MGEPTWPEDDSLSPARNGLMKFSGPRCLFWQSMAVPEGLVGPSGGSWLPPVSCSSGAPPEANAEGEWEQVSPATCLAEVPSDAHAEDEVWQVPLEFCSPGRCLV